MPLTRGQLWLSSYVLIKAAVFLKKFFARFARSFEREGKRKLLSFSTIPVKLRRLHLGRIWLTLPVYLKLCMSDWLNSSMDQMARNQTRNTSSWSFHKNRVLHPKEPFFKTTYLRTIIEGWMCVCIGKGGGGRCGEGRCGHGLPAELERVIINLYVSRGPNHLNHKWSIKELNLCLLMKIKDLEVRGSSRVVSLDKVLCSTFSLLAHVYKWVPATQLPRGGGGGIPYNGLYGEAPPERGTFFRLQVYERVGI